MMSNNSSIGNTATSDLDLSVLGDHLHHAQNRPKVMQQQSGTAAITQPASTYSAMLEFRDGRYDFVIQLISSPLVHARHDAKLTSKLRVWLTRISSHPLLAISHAEAGCHMGKDSWTGEFSLECTWLNHASLHDPSNVSETFGLPPYKRQISSP